MIEKKEERPLLKILTTEKNATQFQHAAFVFTWIFLMILIANVNNFFRIISEK